MAIKVYIVDVTESNKDVIYTFAPSSISYNYKLNDELGISYEQYNDMIESLETAESFIKQEKEEFVKRFFSKKG